MNIDILVAHNRAHLRQMHDLNLRAGKEVFPVPTHEDLHRHFASSLKSARCADEIKDWNALRLPALDRFSVDAVLNGCPDTIMVLGTTVKVEYESLYGGVPPHPYTSTTG